MRWSALRKTAGCTWVTLPQLSQRSISSSGEQESSSKRLHFTIRSWQLWSLSSQTVKETFWRRWMPLIYKNESPDRAQVFVQPGEGFAQKVASREEAMSGLELLVGLIF